MSDQDFFDSMLNSGNVPQQDQPEQADGDFQTDFSFDADAYAADSGDMPPNLDDTIVAGDSFLDPDLFPSGGESELPEDPYDLPGIPPQPEDADPESGGDYEDPPSETEPPASQKTRRTPWHKRKKRRTPFLVRVAVYAVLVILLGVGSGLFVWECAQDVFALGHKDATVTVVVTKEDTVDSITNKLYAKGLIRHKWLFQIYCSISDAEQKIDPGVYQLNSLYDYHALVNGMIEDAATRATATIMIPEGYDCEQIFALLEKNNICAADELRQTASSYDFDYWFLEDVPTGAENRLEGFLYPDTYDFYISDTPENVLSKILNNFNRKCDEDLQAMIQASGYSVQEILTIASMIEEEAANDDERNEISAVLHNRLGSDDLRYLQMDSTVFYACREQGGFDLHFDSPYNTYVYPGLPAGPIDNPGMPSIMAALRPAEVDYRYFATGVDGLNHFFSDYDEFQEFVNSDQYVGNAR